MNKRGISMMYTISYIIVVIRLKNDDEMIGWELNCIQFPLISNEVYFKY